jgi:hypothetical protein
MSKVDELFEQAMQLSEAEREELANRLYQSTLPEVPGEEVSPEEAEKSWAEEIQRRLEMVDRGEYDLKGWREVLDEVRRKYEPKSAP